MAQEVGAAYVTLLPTTRGFGRNVEREMGGAWDNAEKQGSSTFSGLFKKVTAFAATAAVAIGGYFSIQKIFGGGLDRLLNIEDAQAKLRGLGHDAESVSTIMTDALNAVRGTAYGLDAAATVAATAVAAGIEPGQELEKYLRLTADAATIAGVSLDEMGSILNKTTTAGVVYTQELNQLADRGLPIFQWLQDEYGVTAEALRQMVADGQVDAETFRKVIEENIGGAALASGDTVRGALANLGASLSRIGANLIGGTGGVGGAFSFLKDGIQGLTAALAPVEDAAKRAGDAIGTWLGGAVEGVRSLWGDLSSAFTDAGGGWDGILAVAQAAVGSVIDWLSSGGVESIGNALLAGRERLLEAALVLFPAILDAAATTLPRLVEWVGGTALPMIVAAVADALPVLIDTVRDLLPLIVKTLVNLLPMLVDGALGLFMALVDAMIEINPLVIAALVDLLPMILGALLTMLPVLIEGAISLFMGLVQGLVDVLPVLIDTIATLLPQVLTAILDMVPALLDGAIDLFMALVYAVFDVLPVLLEAVIGLIPEIIGALLDLLPVLLEAGVTLFLALVEAVVVILPELLEMFFGTVLPSVIAALGQMIPDLLIAAVDLFMALIDGLFRIIPDLTKAIFVDLIPALIQALVDSAPVLIEAGEGLLGDIWDGLVAAWPEIAAWFTELPERIYESMLSARQWLLDGGKKIVEGIVEGIKSIGSNVGDAIGGVLENARKYLPFSPAKKGPFSGRGWTLYSGKALVGGLIDGLMSEEGALSAATARLMDAARFDLASSVDLAGDGSLRGGDGANPTSPQIVVQTAPGMSEEEIGRAAARQLAFLGGGLEW